MTTEATEPTLDARDAAVQHVRDVIASIVERPDGATPPRPDADAIARVDAAAQHLDDGQLLALGVDVRTVQATREDLTRAALAHRAAADALARATLDERAALDALRAAADVLDRAELAAVDGGDPDALRTAHLAHATARDAAHAAKRVAASAQQVHSEAHRQQMGAALEHTRARRPTFAMRLRGYTARTIRGEED